MTVYKRGSAWRAEIRTNRRGEKQFAITRTFDTRAEAEAFERDVMEQLNVARKAGRSLADHSITLGEAISRFMTEVQEYTTRREQAGNAIQQSGRGKFSQRWINDNKGKLKAWAASHLGGEKFFFLSLRQLEDWIEARRDHDKAESTIRGDLHALQAVYRHAIKTWRWQVENHVPEALADVGTSNKRDRRPTTVENDRLIALFKAMGQAHAAAPAGSMEHLVVPVPGMDGKVLTLPPHDSLTYIATAYQAAIECAMRRSVLFRVRWSWIDWGRRVISVPVEHQGASNKGVPALIPASPRLMEMLADLAGRDSSGQPIRRIGEAADVPVFGSLKGDRAYRLLKDACNVLGIDDLRWHDLRHEACSRLAEMGWTPAQIQAVSGHKTLQSLTRYIHMRPEAIHLLWDRQAAAVAA